MGYLTNTILIVKKENENEQQYEEIIKEEIKKQKKQGFKLYQRYGGKLFFLKEVPGKTESFLKGSCGSAWMGKPTLGVNSHRTPFARK